MFIVRNANITYGTRHPMPGQLRGKLAITIVEPITDFYVPDVEHTYRPLGYASQSVNVPRHTRCGNSNDPGFQKTCARGSQLHPHTMDYQFFTFTWLVIVAILIVLAQAELIRYSLSRARK